MARDKTTPPVTLVDVEPAKKEAKRNAMMGALGETGLLIRHNMFGEDVWVAPEPDAHHQGPKASKKLAPDYVVKPRSKSGKKGGKS